MTPAMESPVDDATFYAEKAMAPGPLPEVLSAAHLEALFAGRASRSELGRLLVSASYSDEHDRLAFALERIHEQAFEVRNAHPVLWDVQAERLEARVFDLWDLLRERLGDERVDGWFRAVDVAA